MKKIYYIGGSPCSGKSTVAEYLANKYNFYYFKADDFLENYTKKGARAKMPICVKQSQMTPEEMWMRDSALQCREEIQFYKEIFQFVMKDLGDIQTNQDIIAEGAAFLPELMLQQRIPRDRYLSITPSREFQISHYKKRAWIHDVLKECSNPENAFENWMNRDCFFADQVSASSIQNGYCSVINNGEVDLESLIKIVSDHFLLEK